MTPAEFEPVIPTGELPQIHALDRAASGISFAYRTHLNRCFVHLFTGETVPISYLRLCFLEKYIFS
jgi:hypothetical protein